MIDRYLNLISVRDTGMKSFREWFTDLFSWMQTHEKFVLFAIVIFGFIF